jgi:hypothetical protein
VLRFSHTPLHAALLVFAGGWGLLGSGCSSTDPIPEEDPPVVQIQELMASNRITIMDEDDSYPDWIELHNPTTSPIELHGYGLSDDHEDPYKWVLPDLILEGEDSLLLFASGKNRTEPTEPLHTSFRLKSSGDQVVLTDRAGVIVDQVEIPVIPPDISLGRHPRKHELWQVFHRPTPGASNGEDGWTNPFDGQREKTTHRVQISEVLTRNRTSLIDEDGDSSDWIELYNTGEETIDLTAYTLSDDLERPYKWRFPEMTLKPDEYIVVFASGKNRRADKHFLHTSFQLSESEPILLADPLGRVIDLLQMGERFSDRSIGRPSPESTSWLYYPEPTPGGPNITQGFDDPSVAPWRLSDTLRITEAQANNRSTLEDEFRENSDWIEIHNVSEEAIELEGVGLTDMLSVPYRWTFPQQSLAPDERILVFLSGRDCVEERCSQLHASFKLSNLGEWLQLTSQEGRIIDRFQVGRTRVDLSSGVLPSEPAIRVYFTEPSPGEPNAEPAFQAYAENPQISIRESGTPQVRQVSITAPSTGSTVRYTLDGSEPDLKSQRYTEPFTVSSSGPIRARAWRDDLLPSEISTRTTLFDANHSLPVVTISIDPYDMFDPMRGIHSLGPDAAEENPRKGANFWKASELPIHLELYESSGKLGLDMALGLRIFGAYGRAMDKKSFRIVAREEYGDNTIDYPLLVDKNYTEFDSFVLRTSGQDSVSTRFRDVLMTQLIKEHDVDYQGYRTVILYINGEYWGIYNIREKINPEMLVRAHGGDPDKVSVLRANGWADHGSRAKYDELISYVERNDLSVDRNYQHAQSLMDVKNFANFWIFQMFYSNADNGNIRYWRHDGPEGRWRWIIYDLDWAFRYVDPNSVAFATNPRGTGANKAFRTILIRRLLMNAEFKDMFLRLCGLHLQETFDPERTLGMIDSLAKEIESEIERDHDRWPDTYTQWSVQIDQMRRFARIRPDRFRTHLKSHFGLSQDDMVRYGIAAP